MRKRAWIALLMLAALPLCALEAVLLPSLAVNVEDQIHHILPSRAVRLPRVSEVTIGQAVTLYLVFQDSRSEEKEVVGTLTGIDPAGKEKTVAKEVCFLKGRTPGKGVLVSGVRITLKSDSEEPLGEHRFILALRDQKSGEECRTECRIKLLPEDVSFSAMEKAEWDKFLPNYYKDPHPRRLPAALDYFFDHEKEMREKGGKGYDPRPILYGFARAFELNPQLWPALAVRWLELPTKEKRIMFFLIVSSMGDEAVRVISGKIGGSEGAALRAFHAKKPLSLQPLRAPWQLDCLWMEFFVTGKFRPVERLCGVLCKGDQMTADEVKAKLEKGSILTAEEKQKFVMFLMSSATQMMLVKNIRHGNPLVAYYMEGMLQKKTYLDETAAARMRDILRQASRKTAEKTAPAETAGTKK